MLHRIKNSNINHVNDASIINQGLHKLNKDIKSCIENILNLQIFMDASRSSHLASFDLKIGIIFIRCIG